MNKIKQQFLDSLSNQNLVSKYSSFFYRVEELEQNYGCDLAEFTTDQFEIFLVKEFEARNITYYTQSKAWIKSYVEWYKANIADIDIENIVNVNAERVWNKYNESIILFSNVTELLDEINKCYQWARLHTDFEEQHPDIEHIVLRGQVIAILTWHGLIAKDICKLKWTDIKGSVNHFVEINGRNLTKHESEILSQWLIKDSYQQKRGRCQYPEPVYVTKILPSSAKKMISVTLKELDDIEKQMSPINSYAFNSRSITQNGNFAYAAERERDMSGDIDYYELLGINRDFPKREASRIIRMYNMYKSKINK